MDPDNPRIIIQLPAPGLLEKALAKIATELHYARPAGRLWPDLLLLPLALAFCVGMAMMFFGPGIIDAGSSLAKHWPFLEYIVPSLFFVFLLSLGVFGVIQGVGMKRPSSIFLGAVMLLIVVSASVFMLRFVH
jgi:hypothetical protein